MTCPRCGSILVDRYEWQCVCCACWSVWAVSPANHCAGCEHAWDDHTAGGSCIGCLREGGQCSGRASPLPIEQSGIE